MFKSNTIFLCKFCGEKITGKLCPTCRAKEKRTEKIIKQLEIEKENKKKGYKIPETLFGFNRNQVLKIYKF